jgi:hypothetical protein
MKKVLVVFFLVSSLMGSAIAAPGDITKAQYIKQAEDRFNAMDANKDGVVTKAERKAYNDKMKAERDAKAKAKKEKK